MRNVCMSKLANTIKAITPGSNIIKGVFSPDIV